MSAARPWRIDPSHQLRPSWAWIGVGALMIGLCVGWLIFPVSEWVAAFQRWVIGLGLWGTAIFAGVFIAATLVLAPDWPLAIAAGMIYGAWAIPIILSAAIVAASLAFFAARYLARGKVRAVLAKKRSFAAVDEAVAEEGWKIVVLLRLSPLVPFNIQNYLFGVTSIPFPHYVAATSVGIIPGTALFVYLGSLGNASGGPLEWAFFGIGLAATIFVAFLVTRKARAKLAETGLDDWEP